MADKTIILQCRLQLLLWAAFFCVLIPNVQAQEPVDYVRPVIGTSGGGNTQPGAVRPWGMAWVNPHNNINVHDGSFPQNSYYHGEPWLYGFGHTEISGAGCGDLGSVVVMPVTGRPGVSPRAYRSRYGSEQIEAGYYATDLYRYGVRAEMTTTIRAGFSRFSWADSVEGPVQLLIDAGNNTSRASKAGRIEQVATNAWIGMNESGMFCGRDNSQKVYFYARVSRRPDRVQLWKEHQLLPSDTTRTRGQWTGAVLEYDELGEPLMLQVGISFVSPQEAKRNLETELNHWNFEQVRSESREVWNRELSRVRVEGGSRTDRVKFYTALYHMLIHPGIFSDTSGSYRTMGDRNIAHTDDGPRYHLFSLWDTYRTVHPFLTLVYPERQYDMVQSMLGMYRENGLLPKWELAGNETLVMVGDPGSAVVAETWIKGLRGFEPDLAWEAVNQTGSPQRGGNPVRPGLETYLEYGYIPMDFDNPGNRTTEGFVWGPVSTTLEYAYADWSVARMAASMGRRSEADHYLNRSRGYRKLFDPSTSLLRPKYSDGSWLEPFDPASRDGSLGWDGSGGPGYVEGSAWQYTFFTPHDIQFMINRVGGPEAFVDQLQYIFDEGLFTLGNEPDMAYPWLFNYVPGEEWRAQREVHKLLDEQYGTGPDGLPGNDDTGTLSGWFVFSALGLYPDNPASGLYQVGVPLFDDISVKLNNDIYPGQTLRISVVRDDPADRHIREIRWNGRPYPSYRVDHEQLVGGGHLELVVGQ